MTPSDDTVSTAEGLRRWARGIYPTEAAVELLIRGGFAHPGCPWIKESDDDRFYWVDATEIPEGSGAMSGGERRLLKIVGALLPEGAPVVLADTLPGLDRDNLALVLAAMAHAAGSHEHSQIVDDPNGRRMRRSDGVERRVSFQKLGSLYPWPTAEEEAR